MGNTYFPLRNFTNVNFASPSMTPHAIYAASVFLPNGNQPAEGYAFHIVYVLSGNTSTSLPSQIGDAQPQYQAFLDGGIALIFSLCPVARGGNTGNLANEATFDPSNGQFGPAYNGNGLEEPIGSAHFLDNSRPMRTKAGGVVLQWAIDQANQGNLPLDVTRIGAIGRSAGGIVAASVALAQDLAPIMFPGGTGQEAISTRQFKVAFLDITATYYMIYDLDGSPSFGPPDNDPNGCDFKPYQFANTSSSPALNVPADMLSQVGIQSRFRCSPLVLADHTSPSWTVDAAHMAANQALKIFCTSGFPGTAGAPYDITNPNVDAGHQTGSEHKAHSIWGQTALKQALGANCRIVATSPDADNGLQDEVIDLSVPGNAAILYAEQVAYAKAAMNYVWPPVPAVHIPVEQLVVNAIKTELATILNSNGYETDVKSVVSGGAPLSTLSEYPTAMVQTMDVDYTDAVQYPKLQGTLRLGLLLAVKTLDDSNAVTSLFIADVLKAIQSRFDLDGFSQDGSNRLLHNLHWSSSQRVIDPDGGDSFSGAVMELEVTFAHPLDDPYTPA